MSVFTCNMAPECNAVILRFFSIPRLVCLVHISAAAFPARKMVAGASSSGQRLKYSLLLNVLLHALLPSYARRPTTRQRKTFHDAQCDMLVITTFDEASRKQDGQHVDMVLGMFEAENVHSTNHFLWKWRSLFSDRDIILQRACPFDFVLP